MHKLRMSLRELPLFAVQLSLQLSHTRLRRRGALLQRTLAALRVYNELHGDLEVPRLFTVPSTAPWPEDLWGLQLGQSASSPA